MHWDVAALVPPLLAIELQPAGEGALQTGDLFYLPPGHTPLVEENTEFVEFSPPAEHQPVLDHVARAAAAP